MRNFPLLHLRWVCMLALNVASKIWFCILAPPIWTKVWVYTLVPTVPTKIWVLYLGTNYTNKSLYLGANCKNQDVYILEPTVPSKIPLLSFHVIKKPSASCGHWKQSLYAAVTDVDCGIMIIVTMDEWEKK